MHILDCGDDIIINIIAYLKISDTYRFILTCRDTYIAFKKNFFYENKINHIKIHIDNINNSIDKKNFYNISKIKINENDFIKSMNKYEFCNLKIAKKREYMLEDFKRNNENYYTYLSVALITLTWVSILLLLVLYNYLNKNYGINLFFYCNKKIDYV
jgi:hypothetical protein